MSSFHASPVKTLMFGLVILLCAMTPAASAPVQVGIAATVVGDVRRSNTAIKKPIKIPRRQRLAWGDTLTTKGKSKLQILLLDRSTLTIGSNARLVINRFVYDPTKERSLGATVSKGAFRFMSGRKTKKSSASVQSSVGTIGIRGTAVDGVVGKEAVKIAKNEPFLDGVESDKDTATLVVLRGPGPNRSGDLDVGLVDVSAAGRTVRLDQPILAAYIPEPGAEPIGPFLLSANGLSKLQDLLAPRVTNANKSSLLNKLLPAAAIGIGLGLLLPGSGGDDGGDRCVGPNAAGAC
ncbi:FecR family protein [Parasphingorhabdus sp.]|uniref:FecR family protein n=1 Tax=Parasphingorhabdus sp. TaxID=2709688 RepID=UPI0032672642